jgi:hypothetical protein
MALTSTQIKHLNKMNKAAQSAALGTIIGNLNGTANIITSATPSTTRQIDSEMTLTPTTTMSVTGGGSLAGVRGGVTISATKTFADGFVYGSQGKVTLNGTFAESSAGRLVGALGQVDLASGVVTSGQVSGLWSDIQMTSPTLTSHAEINSLRVTNSGGSNINALIFGYGKADYFMQLGEPTASFISAGAATPSSTMKKIKVNIGGTDLYILAAATWS